MDNFLKWVTEFSAKNWEYIIVAVVAGVVVVAICGCWKWLFCRQKDDNNVKNMPIAEKPWLIKNTGTINFSFEEKTQTLPSMKRVGEKVTYNLLQKNFYFTGREEYIVQIKKLLSTEIPRPVFIYGTAGTGKSELVIEYAHRNKDEYGQICFLNAENEISIVGGLLAIGKEIGIDADGESENQKTAIKVLDALGTRNKTLLIYDNLEDKKLLREFKPSDISNLDIIATTRYGGNCSQFGSSLEITTMSKDESISLLVKRSGGEDSDKDNNFSSELVEKLSCLPLALTQAASYISDTGISIEQYFHEYEKIKGSLLEANKIEDRNVESVAITIRLVIKKIEERSKDALKLAYCLAFMEPENFPRSVVKNIELPSILSNLGLVNISGESIFMHRLVQEVIQENILTDAEKLETINYCVKWMQEIFDEDCLSNATKGKWYSLIPHIESLLDYSERLEEEQDWRNYIELRAAYTFVLRKLNLFKYALATSEETINLVLKKYEKNDPKIFRILDDFVLSLYEAGEVDRCLEEGEELLGKLSEDIEKSDFSINNTLAKVYLDRGETEKALVLYQEDYERHLALHGEDDLATLSSSNNIGACFFRAGDYEKTLNVWEKVYEKRLAVLGGTHPETLKSVENLLTVYKAVGADKNKIIEIRESTCRALCNYLGYNHPDTLISMKGLAEAYLEAGEPVKALKIQQNVCVETLRTFGLNNTEALRAIKKLAIAYAMNNNPKKSIELGEYVYQRFLQISGKYHPDTLSSGGDLIIVYGSIGDFDKAIEFGEKVKESFIVGRENTTEILFIKYNLGISYANKDIDKAISLLEDVHFSKKNIAMGKCDELSTETALLRLYAEKSEQDDRDDKEEFYGEKIRKVLQTCEDKDLLNCIFENEETPQ